MADHINIRQAPGTWVVRAAGAVLGESQNALELTEGSYPPVIYFPRGDIAMAFLDQTEKTSHCPHKGDASYFTIEGKSGPLTDAAWSYEDPKDAVAAIKDHLAFYTDRVTVEQL
ncbi:hypothetical protein AIOL_003456 [Candidatus Rhodobacter oscarellae]|uniref:DUF427 domain-containing protein n=1 Tax=Candidatus Rhodobacter oscarellae TaxID=1675527 RepID=A0A0J9E720_9RHOB|nr:DUF427 domain-containing protein [Candidatus Rhodobacter lobularis]KMW58481.1 hypothetical protein AIOL_003456 [Candidatus Rhodobacter lobularis]